MSEPSWRIAPTLGVRSTAAPRTRPTGSRDFVIEDPEGHRLAFGTPLA